MSNLTMTIQIEAPDLVAALTQLAAAIHPSAQTLNIPRPQVAVPAPAAPVPVAGGCSGSEHWDGWRQPAG